MPLPEPGTKEYNDMIDFIRADLDSDMRYSKIEMMARKVVKEDGRDFDEAFAKWQSERTVQIVCAWCGLDMGSELWKEVPCSRVSHGICPKCAEAYDKEIDELPKGERGNELQKD